MSFMNVFKVFVLEGRRELFCLPQLLFSYHGHGGNIHVVEHIVFNKKFK